LSQSRVDPSTVSPPQKATSYCLWQDGAHWACIRGDFESIEGEIIGVGETPCEAVTNLIDALSEEDGGDE
jgi:hypothetical protein